MARFIINGVGVSGFSFPDSSLHPVELPWTNENGLTTTYEIEKNTHKLATRAYRSSIKGYHFHFTFDFSKAVSAATLKKIQQVIELEQAGQRIILTARKDNNTYFYEVYYSGNTIDLGVHKGGTLANYNNKVTCEWSTKYLQPSLDWNIVQQPETDPIVISTTPAAGTGLYSPIEGMQLT
jgi:hypothetical protein